MTPLPPGALDRLLQTLPPERPEPFPHLANLSAEALLLRRSEISGKLKTLEQERQVIDAELLRSFPLPNSAVVFVSLMDGSFSSDHAPVGTIPPNSVRPSRVFSGRRSGMDQHNRW